MSSSHKTWLYLAGFTIALCLFVVGPWWAIPGYAFATGLLYFGLLRFKVSPQTAQEMALLWPISIILSLLILWVWLCILVGSILVSLGQLALGRRPLLVQSIESPITFLKWICELYEEAEHEDRKLNEF